MNGDGDSLLLKCRWVSCACLTWRVQVGSSQTRSLTGGCRLLSFLQSDMWTVFDYPLDFRQSAKIRSDKSVRMVVLPF